MKAKALFFSSSDNSNSSKNVRSLLTVFFSYFPIFSIQRNDIALKVQLYSCGYLHLHRTGRVQHFHSQVSYVFFSCEVKYIYLFSMHFHPSERPWRGGGVQGAFSVFSKYLNYHCQIFFIFREIHLISYSFLGFLPSVQEVIAHFVPSKQFSAITRKDFEFHSRKLG